MIAKWIICGILVLCLRPVCSQIDGQRQVQIDSLLLALDTTSSKYQISQIADHLLGILDTLQANPTLYEVYRQKGLAHFRLGNFGEALLSVQSASRIAYALQDSFLIGQTSYRIGTIQQGLELLTSAEEHFQTAVNIFSELDSLRWVAYVHNAFGVLESQRDNWDGALRYYQQSFALLEDAGLADIASVAINNIGDVYLHKRNYEQSLSWFRRGLELSEQQKRTNDVAIAHMNIGESWRGLNRYDRAIQEIEQGLSIAFENGFKKTASDGLKTLADTYEKMNLSDSALTYLQAHLQLQDAIQREENEARLEELYVVYETEKAKNEIVRKENEVEDLKQQKRLTYLNTLLLVSLLGLALIISFFFFVRNRMKRRLAESELLNQKLASNQMRVELEAKQKDLTNLALEIARKNELFNQTNQSLSAIQTADLPADQRKKIKQLIRYNTQQLRINEDLEELQVNIEKVNSGFFAKLSSLAPDLTASEKQLCALLRLKLGTKEIASIRNISPKSVEMARYRLRKKLPIEAQDDLYDFVQEI